MTQPDPEQSIGGGQLRSLHRTLKHPDLVTEREILELQSHAAAERHRQRREEPGDDGSRCDSKEGQTPSLSLSSEFAGTTGQFAEGLRIPKLWKTVTIAVNA